MQINRGIVYISFSFRRVRFLGTSCLLCVQYVLPLLDSQAAMKVTSLCFKKSYDDSREIQLIGMILAKC
jgi:hypothetical protein